MVSAEIAELFVAVALTSSDVIVVSVALAVIVWVRSLTATEAPTDPAVVPLTLESVMATPPESAVMAELSLPVSVRSPVVETLLPAPISARASVSTMLTVNRTRTGEAPTELVVAAELTSWC